MQQRGEDGGRRDASPPPAASAARACRDRPVARAGDASRPRRFGGVTGARGGDRHPHLPRGIVCRRRRTGRHQFRTMARWRSASEATIQIRPQPQGDTEALVAQATAMARETPGVVAAEPFSLGQSERLLEPWLGSGLDLAELPVPRLIELQLDPESPPDLDRLRTRLRDAVPGASLDDHAQWLARLSNMAPDHRRGGCRAGAARPDRHRARRRLRHAGCDGGQSRASSRCCITCGAHDAYIAREFRRRFLRLGLEGGLIGGGGGDCRVRGAGLGLGLLAPPRRRATSWRPCSGPSRSVRVA